MKSTKKKIKETFGLSFLDCICCGFGAVILLFVLTTREDGKTVSQMTGVFEAEVEKAEEQLEEKKLNLSKLVNTIENTEMKIVEVAGLGKKVIENIKETKREISEKNKVAAAQVKEIGELESELKRVEEEISRQQSGPTKDTGKSIRPSIGSERRHYLTGLKVDGERSLLLVDTSLSMLDTSVINVAQYYRHADPDQKLQSAKWIRVLDSIDWLLATMESKEYQIYLYNENVRSALPGSEGTWLNAKDVKQVQDVAHCFWNYPPEGGSNLEKAFKFAMQLNPKPDNIYIFTDGLPNHSDSYVSGATVSTKERLRHFNFAMQQIPPRSMPVNTIMFPFQGEPDAPFAYWRLAHKTNGSFFVPADGWPN